MTTINSNVNVRFSYKKNKTYAILSTKDSNEVIIERSVNVKEGDQFDKRSGRALAFKKAMKHTAEQDLLTKVERTNLWNTFRTTVRQPK